MNEVTQIFGAISVISGIIGGALFLRAKVVETAKGLEVHEAADAVVHTSMTDRLARIETKIDMLVRRGQS